jgi:hypothetical protein
MEETTALIDADSLIYFEMGKSTLEEALEGIDMRIHQMLTETECNRYAGFLTSGRCFRYNVAKTRPYKGNRKYSSKPIIFPAIKEYLRQKWNFTSISELEADDLVAIYADKNTIICSPDKDVLYQVSGYHYNYRTAEAIHTTPEEAETFLWKQVLMGDPTDGIPGIPKLGPKTADKLLNAIQLQEMPTFVLNKYIEKFGNQEGILKFAETFRLVYILKTKEDVLRETGIELKDLVINDVKPLNENEWL